MTGAGCKECREGAGGICPRDTWTIWATTLATAFADNPESGTGGSGVGGNIGERNCLEHASIYTTEFEAVVQLSPTFFGKKVIFTVKPYSIVVPEYHILRYTSPAFKETPENRIGLLGSANEVAGSMGRAIGEKKRDKEMIIGRVGTRRADGIRKGADEKTKGE
ncbi:hypothetical protein DFH09DRAFT_1103514 [Mycena vulgaris]|nr:hypothetical protein DFH09DRAFT_1103514 [Mycena vulgaris]